MTRVTQSMLSSNLLYNLNNGYNKVASLQEQIQTGSKINRPSDDPVIAITSMGHRRDLGRIEQFTRNMNEVNSWLDATDTAFSESEKLLHRVHELVVDAANGTKTDADRKVINSEIEQLRKQLHSIANTEVGGKHIFSGTNTQSPLFDENGDMTANLPGINNAVEIEIYDGIMLQVNTPGGEMFRKLDNTMKEISDTLKEVPSDSKKISSLISKIGEDSNPDSMRSLILDKHAAVGAVQNRAEVMQERLSLREVMIKKQMSDNESVDYAKAITDMVSQQAIHQAGLSVGARIIQQTLVDFMR